MTNIFESANKTAALSISRKTYTYTDVDGYTQNAYVYRFGNIRMMYFASYLKELSSISLDQEDLPSIRQSVEVLIQSYDSTYETNKFRHAGIYIDPTNGFNINGYHYTSYCNSNARTSMSITSTSLFIAGKNLIIWYV